MSARGEVRAKLVALYERHRPEQAKFVDTLLKQCPAGKEAALLAKVEQKFTRDPAPPAKRPHVDPRNRASAYAPGDRVMVPLQRGAGGPAGAPWVPGEVTEAADPGGALPSGGKYAVVTDEHCDPPHHRKRLIVFDEARDSIRPEVCFVISGRIGQVDGKKLAQYATVLPRPDDPSVGPRDGESWRFFPKDRVTCRVDKEGDGTGAVEWVAGTVRTAGGREPGSRTGTISAYKVELDCPDETRGVGDKPWLKIERDRIEGRGGHFLMLRQVWVSRDEHWLVRPLAQQPPGPINTPSLAGLRYAVRPVEERGEVVPGRWERYDHATGRSEPAEPPDGGLGAAAAAPRSRGVGEAVRIVPMDTPEELARAAERAAAVVGGRRAPTDGLYSATGAQ